MVSVEVLVENEYTMIVLYEGALSWSNVQVFSLHYSSLFRRIRYLTPHHAEIIFLIYRLTFR